MNAWDDPRIKRGLTAQLQKRRARLAAGEKHLGWKMGFGAPGALTKLEITAPITGYLLRSALLDSGAKVSLQGWKQPVAEPEIAVRMAADVPAGATPQAALASVGSLTPAIELADLDLIADETNIEQVLAGDIYNRHVVLSGKSRAGNDLAGLAASIKRRGKEAGRTDDPQALTGKLGDILAHLADTLAAYGERLSRDDLVICGSVLPPIVIEPDETSLDYELAPIGAVTVKFTS